MCERERLSCLYYIGVYVCVCVCEREREREENMKLLDAISFKIWVCFLITNFLLSFGTGYDWIGM